jgi:cbb3-type cytochrome oxidase subunit 3
MVLAVDSVAYETGYYVGKAMFFLALVAVLWWILRRRRRRN